MSAGRKECEAGSRAGASAWELCGGSPAILPEMKLRVRSGQDNRGVPAAALEAVPGLFRWEGRGLQGGPDIALAGLWGQSRQPEERQGDRVRQRLQDGGIQANAYSRRCPRALPQAQALAKPCR